MFEEYKLEGKNVLSREVNYSNYATYVGDE